MTTFNNVAKYKVSVDARVRYDLGIVLGERDGKPVTAVLVVTMANDLNPDFLNEVLKATPGDAKGRTLNPATATAAQKMVMIRSALEEDKKLFAKHVIKGWENVFDDTGREMPFSPEECLNFLNFLPEHIFKELRIYCQIADNFIGVDAAVLAKN